MKKNSKPWFYIGAGVILIAVGIVLLANIDWLKIFNLDIGAIVLFAGVALIIAAYLNSIPPRDAKVYLNPDGTPDINTERSYEAKKLKFGQGFLSRGKFSIPKNALKSFSVKNGIVTITVKSGKSISAPLSELALKYHLEENKITGEQEIAGYSLKHTATDKKITIYYPGSAFEEDEWKDIAGVLANAAVVKESMTSKVTSFVSKAKSFVEDFDFSDIAGSVASKATDAVLDKAAQKLVDFATDKLPEQDSKKGRVKRIIKKIFFWILVVGLVLYMIFDVWSQIEIHNNGSFYFSEGDEEEYAVVEAVAEEIDEIALTDTMGYDEVVIAESVETDMGVPVFNKLTEYMEVWAIRFYDGRNGQLALQHETGRGVYLAPSGRNYELHWTDEYQTRLGPTCTVYSVSYLDGPMTKMVFNLYSGDDPNAIKGELIGMNGETEFEFVGELLRY